MTCSVKRPVAHTWPQNFKEQEKELLIGAVIAICIVLLVLAFVAPRLSRHPQRGVDKSLGTGQRAGGKLPGFLGRLAQKPFSSSRRATNKSAAAGRRGRGKMPD